MVVLVVPVLAVSLGRVFGVDVHVVVAVGIRCAELFEGWLFGEALCESACSVMSVFLSYNM